MTSSSTARKIRVRLGWRPPFTLDEGLAACRRAGE